MRAISLWQPWASAMASGLKRNETRIWPTAYRGDLVICSAKRKPTIVDCGDQAALYHALSLPYGYALCVVDLYDVVPTSSFHGPTPMKISRVEADLGNYELGRFAWLTRNCRKLAPVPVIGRQGFWNLPIETVELITCQQQVVASGGRGA